MSRKPLISRYLKNFAGAFVLCATATLAPATEAEWRQLIEEGDECYRENDFDCAMQKFEAAFQVSEETFALTDGRGGDTLKRLAYVADARERPDLAEDYHRQALSAYVLAYGDDTEPVLEQERVLAIWYRDNNRMSDAVTRFRTLLNKRRAMDDTQPRDIAVATYELGDALLREERYGEAALLLSESVEPTREAFGEESQALRLVLDRLARAQGATRNTGGQLETLTHLLNVETALFGEDSEEVRATDNRLRRVEQQVDADSVRLDVPPLTERVAIRQGMAAESLDRLQEAMEQTETRY